MQIPETPVDADTSLGAAPERTIAATRGVGRYLVNLGYAVLTEFTLANHRRADVIGLSDTGHFVIVE